MIQQAQRQPPLRILALDPNELLLAGLRARIAPEPDFVLLATLSEPARLLDAVALHQPDLVLMELELGASSAIDLIAQLRASFPTLRVLIYASETRVDLVRSALDAGAVGYLLKSDPASQLFDALRSLATDAIPVLAPALLPRLTQTQTQEPDLLAQLTAREREVLCLIGRGLSRVAIARTLDRSPKTIDAHRNAIMGKLGLKDRVQLARFAIREGLADL